MVVTTLVVMVQSIIMVILVLLMIIDGVLTHQWNNLISGKVTHDTYGVLNLKATNKTIEVNFYKKGTTNILPISHDIILTIGNQNFTDKIVNGSFKMNYTPQTSKYNITAIVDNQKLSKTIIP